MYYLAHVFILGLIWLALYWHRKDLRKKIIFASLLFLPFGATQPLFVPSYWNPPVLYKFFGMFDIESFLWCFFIAGIAAVLYEEIFRYSLQKAGSKLRSTKSSKIHKYVIYSLLGLLVIGMIGAHTLGFSVLRVSFLLVIPIVLYMIIVRHDLWRESVISGILFTILYFLTLLSLTAFFPGYHEYAWTDSGLWGFRIYGLPLEEYCFAFLLGMMWSILYEEIQNLKVIRLAHR